MDQQLVDSARPSNDWMSAKWRPMMGIMYMVVCIFDFILFPIAWSTGQAFLHVPVTEWNPLTLQGAGLFHMAMGAVLGVAAWSRGQEKITAMTVGSSNGAFNSSSSMSVAEDSSSYSGQTPVNSPPAPKFGSAPRPPDADQPVRN